MFLNSKGTLRTYHGLFLLLFQFVDMLVLVACGMLVFAQYNILDLNNGNWKAVVIIAALTFSLVAGKFGLYQPWRGKRLRHELMLLLLISSVAVGGAVLVSEAVGLLSASVGILSLGGAWVACLAGALTGVRLIIRPLLKLLRRNGINQRNVLMVGMSPKLNQYVTELQEHPEFGFSFTGYVDERENIRHDVEPVIERLGSPEHLVELCQSHPVDQIWLGYPVSASQRLVETIALLKHDPIVIRLVMDFDATHAQSKTITSILSRPILDIDVTLTDGVLGSFAKTVFDKVLAAPILLMISPLMLAIAMAIKFSSPGPVFYRQTRLTWRNKPFEMVKFRSMPTDVEKNSGARWARPGDNRATKVGAILRATSLDELPQFWNVLKGDMSIVGPRPERPELVENFKDEIPLYMKKHRVKAGITGWAQINGFRGDTDLSKRIEYDLYYIRHNSLYFDLKIIILTLFKGMIHRNAY